MSVPVPAGAQGLRLPPKNDSPVTKVAAASRQTPKEGLIRELYKSSPRPPWTPSFSVAFRLIVLIRVSAAMYTSNTTDCDEAYNYWEPLHFLLYGDGFRTWEYSSAYAIRSWAYLLLHAGPAKLIARVNPDDKRIAFFAVRLSLAVLSSLTEARFYRSVSDYVNPRVGRYTLLFLLFNAGMYNSATTLLPSTFSMYFVTLGWSYALEPVSSNATRTFKATLSFAVAAVVGWPFSVLLSLPFFMEELFLTGSQIPATSASFPARCLRLVKSAPFPLAILAAVVAVDSYLYGHLAIVPLNIIKYNVLSKSGGPDLYGTEPWYFYILNGILNFNLLLPLALVALPALLVSALLTPKKLGVAQLGSTSSLILLLNRLLPFYIWFGVLTAQAHKEERFMFPAFPLICFQAAVALCLGRGWMEEIHVKATKAPFRTARTPVFSLITTLVVLITSAVSVSRIFAISSYYRAPMPLFFHFQYQELPSLAITHFPKQYPKLNLTHFDQAEERMDLAPLESLNLTLCYGKEWYRFPSSFLHPEQVRTEFIKSDFDGILPKHFVERRDQVWQSKSSIERRAEIAALSPAGFNDQNVEEMDRYVPVESCSYIVDLDLPGFDTDGVASSSNEKAYARDTQNWHRVACWPFLDASKSSRLRRAFYVPFLRDTNVYGDYCLLRNTKLRNDADAFHSTTE